MIPTASFTYRALSGAPLYQARRFDHADGSKSFGLQRADGTGGWTGGQGAMTNVGRVVYRWPELRGHATVLGVEGECCADALWNIGVPATTNVGVAGMWVFPLFKSLLPVVVAFLLPTTDTLDHRRVGNGTHRHGLFQEPMEELPAMA